MRKAACFIMSILFIIGSVQCGYAESMTQTDSALAWLMELYEYDLPDSITDDMRAFFTPLEFDCGTVQVTLDEVLYDGEYLYTSARVMPVDSTTTLIMPASALVEDFVAGGYHENLRSDPRSFMEAAVQDQKTLLMVEVHPVEFDRAEYYFLDHRQDAGDQTTVFSGASVGWIGEAPTIHLLITVTPYDPSADTIMEMVSFEFPVEIQRVGTIGYED